VDEPIGADVELEKQELVRVLRTQGSRSWPPARSTAYTAPDRSSRRPASSSQPMVLEPNIARACRPRSSTTVAVRAT